MPETITYSGVSPENTRYVEYMDLAGGLNTKRDPHAVDRNQLTSSINCLYLADNSISKRPGNTFAVTANGATGSGVGAKGMASAQFNNITNLLVLTGNAIWAAPVSSASFTSVGAMSSSAINIQTAQMFDQTSNADVAFITDGFDVPKIYKGGGVAMTSAVVPKRRDGATNITPAYCAVLQSHLFYSGDPSEPTSVWISDPWNGQSFTANASLNTAGSAAAYIPYLLGWDDGVYGGAINAMYPLGYSMMVYKQSSIYRMDNVGFYGDMVWRPSLVSSSVGCLSPHSLVTFDTFQCFLGFDGVYQTDGYGTRRISDNVPTFFSGAAAAISNRTTAVGVRYGQRYVLFYDDQAAGFATTGIWFDFAKPDAQGFPTAGLWKGMNPADCVILQGPQDKGNFAWADATQDRVAIFDPGLNYSDFTNNITSSFAGKADYFLEEWPEGGPMRQKCVNPVWLLVGIPQQAASSQLNFTMTVTNDALQQITTSGTTGQTPPIVGGVYGVSKYAQAPYGVQSGSTRYVPVKIPASSCGTILQAAFAESSTFGWNVLGYTMRVNANQVKQ